MKNQPTNHRSSENLAKQDGRLTTRGEGSQPLLVISSICTSAEPAAAISDTFVYYDPKSSEQGSE